MGNLDDKRGRGRQPRNAAPLEMHFEHLLTTDPASSLVADDHGRVVGFGIVMRREARAFLSFLFVEPRWQARGMGRAILDACLAGADGPSALATCAEADQPISTSGHVTATMPPRISISGPNTMMAAEMAIIRLTHVADLPSPEELIRKLQNSPVPPAQWLHTWTPCD